MADEGPRLLLGLGFRASSYLHERMGCMMMMMMFIKPSSIVLLLRLLALLLDVCYSAAVHL